MQNFVRTQRQYICCISIIIGMLCRGSVFWEVDVEDHEECPGFGAYSVEQVPGTFFWLELDESYTPFVKVDY